MSDSFGIQDELEALAQLFITTGGRLDNTREQSSWINQSGWVELLALTKSSTGSTVGIPPSILRQTLQVAFPHVFGVKFDRNRVVAIDLSHNGLTGMLPTELSQLRFLRSLNLRDNLGLRGALPCSFVAQPPPQLRYCYIDGTKLERTLPYTSARMLEITRVHASGTAVSVRFITGGSMIEGDSTCTTHWTADVTETELFMMLTSLVATRQQQEQPKEPSSDDISRTAKNATGPERIAAAIKLQRIYRARIERTKFRRFLRSLFEAHLDPASGYRYFVDTRTGEASWTRPGFLSTPRLDGEQSASLQSAGESTASGDDWQPYDDGNGNTYYWNSLTGESTWEPPHLRSRLQQELVDRYGVDKTEAERFELFFREIDVDGTGEIDRDEFARLCGDLGMALSAAQITRAFNELDTSGDGQLSRNEVFAWINRHF